MLRCRANTSVLVRAARIATAACEAKTSPSATSDGSKASNAVEYRLSDPNVSASMKRRSERMLRTPVVAWARAANFGHRSSVERSPVWNTSWFLIASRHGPWSVSAWMASTIAAASLLAAGDEMWRPSTNEIPAKSHRSRCSTASRTIASRIS
jgi:hypothetical protein